MRPEFKKIDELLKSMDAEERKLAWTLVQQWKRENPVPRFEVNQKVRITCIPYKLGIVTYMGQVGLHNRLSFTSGRHTKSIQGETLLQIEAI